MMAPRVSFSDPGSIAGSCTSSLSHSDNKLARAKNYRESCQRSIQKRSRKNAFVARRTRLRSTSPSPSIKIESPQEDDDRLNQIALSRGGNSTGNNNSRNSSSYNNNKYRKDGNGVYQCPFKDCLYRYNLRRELNRHQNVHLYAGRDKYRCMNCNSGLCRLDSVKRHMEAKGKTECLKMGLYQEFKENGDLVRVRECKSSWYGSSDSNAANDLKTSKP
ncbi:hypothetical protein BGZ49_010267 [Haplosporangium sp. Z 27]|nr:hypothetical protein BGZ49_010267 [Haplosporangium sp. Z 27]